MRAARAMFSAGYFRKGSRPRPSPFPGRSGFPEISSEKRRLIRRFPCRSACRRPFPWETAAFYGMPAGLLRTVLSSGRETASRRMVPLPDSVGMS